MGMIDPMLQEYAHESASTRKLIEVVPQGALDWKPHPKSMSLGQLACHLAETPTWAGATLDLDVFEMDPASYKPLDLKKVPEILAAFDRNTAAAAERMKKASDGDLMKPWTFKVGGKVAFTMPKVAVLRSFIFNHSIHHRGQLTVYLRLKEVPLPQVYGPTADSPMM